MEYIILHNEVESRFETTIDGLVSIADYVRTSDVLAVTHTGVPKELEGRGIAAALTKALLDYAKENGLKVNPVCPYTATYIQRHPEYKDLLN